MKIQKKLTAGKLVLEGRCYHLDLTVLEHVEKRRAEKVQEINEKKQKEELEYLKLCYHADCILQRYGGNTDVSKWKRKDDIITYLKPLKRSGDPGMTLNRAEAEQRFEEWKDRERRSTEADDDVMALFDSWKKDYEKDTDKDESDEQDTQKKG